MSIRPSTCCSSQLRAKIGRTPKEPVVIGVPMIRSKKLTKASARSPQFYRHRQEFFNILVFYPIGNALWLSVNFGGSVVILQSAQVEFRAIIRNKPKSPDLRSTSTSLTIASRPPTDSSSRPSKLLEVQRPIQEIANSASERMKECLLYFAPRPPIGT